MTPVILVLNAGSSSVKFALFRVTGEELRRLFRGQIEGLGAAPHLSVEDEAGTAVADRHFASTEVASQEEAVRGVLAWLKAHSEGLDLVAVGHRVVHGGPVYSATVLVDPDVLQVLAGFEPLAPLHQAHNLAPIRELARARPELPQVACFDTAFHSSAPLVAQLFGLPHELFAAGVRRYGFHGLSYEHVVQALGEHDPAPPRAAWSSPTWGTAAAWRPSATGGAWPARWASPRSTGCRWGRAVASLTPVSSST